MRRSSMAEVCFVSPLGVPIGTASAHELSSIRFVSRVQRRQCSSMATSLETIARHLGVSKVTVSNALRGSGRVSAAMCERVNQAAKELGYRPNPLVTALMTNLRRNRSSRRCTLGFLNCYKSTDFWRQHNPTFLRFQEGAERRAAELGYRIEAHRIGEFAGHYARLGTVFQARGIPGFILAPLPMAGMRLELEWENLAMVAIGHSFTEFQPHRVSNHQFHSIILAMKHAVATGSRRIGLVMPKMDDDKVENVWTAGYVAAGLRHGLPMIAPLTTPDFKREVVLPWIRKNRVDTVISTNEYVLKWLRADGLRVPEDLRFVHLDWCPEKGAMAGVDQHSDRIGAAAVDLLVEQVNNNEYGIPTQPKTVMIEGGWSDGPTLPAVSVNA